MLIKKSKVDYSAPHNRQMFFRMRLLKFYKQIEYDENVYHVNAQKILEGTLPYKYINQIEKLRLKHEEEKKERWKKIQNKGATKMGIQIRNIIKRGSEER
tara:strand:- start:1834 stop:2133 length:300 start_codon:yes stop_codon:yes gene_type:complete